MSEVLILLKIFEKLTSIESRPSLLQYKGINYNLPVSLKLHAYSKAQSMMMGLGPAGMLGSLLLPFIMPLEFNKFGNRAGLYSGWILPGNGGTFAGAIQNYQQHSINTALTTSRLTYLKLMQRLFYKTYFDVVLKPGLKLQKLSEAEINRRREQFAYDQETNLLTPAKLLDFLVDPTGRKQILNGMKLALAGIRMWAVRLNPLDTETFNRTKQMQSTVRLMAVQSSAGALHLYLRQLEAARKEASQVNATPEAVARLNQLEKRRNEYNYGGFSSGAVALLSGILSNQLNVLAGSTNSSDIKDKLLSFKQRVRDLTQALAPLRDIFGNDIPNLITRLQQVSGQTVSQMTKAQIRSTSTMLADMSRFSGVLVGQMVNLGAQMAALVADGRGSNWARLGARNAGLMAAGMLAPGTGAFGVDPQQFQQQTLRMIASAQNSKGARLMAMAYGKIELQQASKGGSLYTMLQFDQLVANLIASNKGISPLEAAKRVVARHTLGSADKADQVNLYEGMDTKGYIEYRQSGRTTQWAARDIWRDELNTASMRARQSYNKQNVLQVKQAFLLLSTLELSQVANSPLTAVQKGGILYKKLGLDQTNDPNARERAKIVYNMLQNDNFTQSMANAASSGRMQRFILMQAEIRDAFRLFDNEPSDMYSRFTTMLLSDWSKDDKGNWISAKNTRVTEKAISLYGQQIFGITSDKTNPILRQKDIRNKTLESLDRLTKLAGGSLLGRKRVSDLVQYAVMGKGKEDPVFLQQLKLTASMTKLQFSQLYVQKLGIYKDFGLNAKFVALNEAYTSLGTMSTAVRNQYGKALSLYKSVVTNKDATEKQKKEAKTKFLTEISRLYKEHTGKLTTDKSSYLEYMSARIDNLIFSREVGGSKAYTLLRNSRNKVTGSAGAMSEDTKQRYDLAVKTYRDKIKSGEDKLTAAQEFDTKLLGIYKLHKALQALDNGPIFSSKLEKALFIKRYKAELSGEKQPTSSTLKDDTYNRLKDRLKDGWDPRADRENMLISVLQMIYKWLQDHQ